MDTFFGMIYSKEFGTNNSYLSMGMQPKNVGTHHSLRKGMGMTHLWDVNRPTINTAWLKGCDIAHIQWVCQSLLGSLLQNFASKYWSIISRRCMVQHCYTIVNWLYLYSNKNQQHTIPTLKLSWLNIFTITYHQLALVHHHDVVTTINSSLTSHHFTSCSPDPVH